ncbi:phosphoribulokinase [Teredinibacter purpureus]|uniref:phosphoribulokinase n=1 Tax=Teredinibacter purpureus TaxID=2731756 RepID=UPI000B2960AB|nr:phosphoribulokinase [Teredinibacter purpureus]
MQTYIDDAIQAHGLPPEFKQTVEHWYQPLAGKIAAKANAQHSPLILGIQGTQGSGKSTLADFLRLILEHSCQMRCAVLSIDDFYLTRAQRQSLAKTVHPLLATRGVPGTHDLALAKNTLQQLQTLTTGESCSLVRFDKATDDRASKEYWTHLNGPIDIIILEGWCVGLSAEAEPELVNPINTLEANEDPTGVWRHYVNSQLADQYATLFKLIDYLAVLKAPSFDCVFQWRLLQEQKLKQKWLLSTPEKRKHSNIQSPKDIERFISHYQRLTEHALNTLPKQADWTLSLDAQHSIIALTEKDTP